MRGFLKALVLGAGVLSLIAAGAAAAELTKIKIGVLKVSACGPVFFAQEKGYFAKEGLEAELIPGDGALLAPDWVPWSERLRPGDLGVGDLLPPMADDHRLVPAYLLSDDPAVEAVAFELGLGRVRVMSAFGRDDAAERWYAGDGGPDTAMAAHAPGRCGTCGFYLPIDGSLGAVFGVCGNAYSPRDGAVVAADAGCGAHSEAAVEPAAPPPPPPTYDDGVDIERA